MRQQEDSFKIPYRAILVLGALLLIVLIGAFGLNECRQSKKENRILQALQEIRVLAGAPDALERGGLPGADGCPQLGDLNNRTVLANLPGWLARGAEARLVSVYPGHRVCISARISPYVTNMRSIGPERIRWPELPEQDAELVEKARDGYVSLRSLDGDLLDTVFLADGHYGDSLGLIYYLRDIPEGQLFLLLVIGNTEALLN